MGARTLSLVVQVMTSYYSTMFIVDVLSIIPVDLLLLLPEQPISGPHHANDSDVAALQPCKPALVSPMHRPAVSASSRLCTHWSSHSSARFFFFLRPVTDGRLRP